VIQKAASKSFLNGKQSVGFIINKLSEEDLEEVSTYNHNYVEDFNARNQGVKLAVTTSVTTTIIAFAPLLFLEGRMEMMFELAFVVIFILGFSLLEAFFVFPAHVGSPHILLSHDRGKRTTKIRDALDKAIVYMKIKVYGRLLKKIINGIG